MTNMTSWPPILNFIKPIIGISNLADVTSTNASDSFTLERDTSDDFAEYDSSLFLGNGKIGLVTPIDPVNVGISSCSISTATTVPRGTTRYSDNMLETFNPFAFSFACDATPLLLSPVRQSLQMQSAIYTCVVGNQVAEIQSDILVARHLPFCTIQTLTIRPVVNIPNFRIEHEINCKDNLVNPDYNNNVMYEENKPPRCLLSGRARIGGTDAEAVVACSYEFSDDQVTSHQGFNVYLTEPNRAFNRIMLANLVAGGEYKVHVVSALMTSFDFDLPLHEVKRIALNIVGNGVHQARGRHVNDWTKNVWKTDIVIQPKIGITSQEEADIALLNRYLRYSLYNIYSSVREGVNQELNPANMGIIDTSGSVLYSGDLFLVPLLLLLRPEMARAVLEFRHKTLAMARQLAAGYGYEGAKFPFEDDTIGYKTALYWSTTSNITVYNTALICINTWNYFRSTKDREWLRAVGYPILRDGANFFASVIETVLETPDPLSCDCSCPYEMNAAFNLINNTGLTGKVSALNNSFTNSVVKMALRFAVEASYELTYAVDDNWVTASQALPVPAVPAGGGGGPPNVLKFDDAYAGESLPFAEPLITFMPYYTDPSDQRRKNIAYSGMSQMEELYDNLNAYSINITNGNRSQARSMDIVIKSVMHSSLSQSVIKTDVDKFLPFMHDDLRAFLSNNVKGAWGNFGSSTRNDVAQSALYIWMFVQGIARLNIEGGVSETRFYYNQFGLSCPLYANMPTSWSSLSLKQIGHKSTIANFVVYNKVVASI
jgi:hypothetical protein